MLPHKSFIILTNEIEEKVEQLKKEYHSKRIITFFKEKFLIDDAKEVISQAYISEADLKYIIVASYEFNISIGNETEILQQIQMDTIQVGIITAGPYDTFAPIVRVINYPFLFKNSTQADAILDGPLGQEILDDLENVGFKGLSFSENGFRNLTNNKHAIKTASSNKSVGNFRNR